MGKELPLARKEVEGRPELLAVTSNGEPITTAYNGNEGKKKLSPHKGSYRRKAENTETKGKGGSKAERANAGSLEKKGRGRDNKDRESDRGDEGEDKPARRSAQELGIVHPGSYCDELETVPHHWVGVDKPAEGVLFQCKFCLDYLWLPVHWTAIDRLSEMTKRLGKVEGYCHFLDRHRAAKILMAKLQDLRRLEKETVDKREFARIADRILSEKDYDRND